MTTGEILGVHHIKIPVTDLVRSRAWYERVFDLEPFIEWPDDEGVVRGVSCAPEPRSRQLCAGSSGKFENQLSDPGWRASTDRQSSLGALAVTSSSRASNTHHASCAISSSS
jgi:hypothetical protein